MCIFLSYQPATLPEGSVGHETAFSTDLGTDPKFDGLFLARLFALLLHIYAFVYLKCIFIVYHVLLGILG